MKILAPVRSVDEVEMLAESGAEEFYCGITPAEWQQKYTGMFWISRRSPNGGGMQSTGELRALTDESHKRGIPVFVTLNAPMYTGQQTADVAALARALDEEAGVDALIIGDLRMLMELSAMKLRAALHVSSIMAALNTEAIRFLMDFGPKRVIFPRSVTLAEMTAIARDLRGAIELEAFVMNEGCAFEEGFCSTTHHHSVGAFCTNLSDMRVRYESDAGEPLSPHQTLKIERNHARYRDYIWYLNGNGCSTTAAGLPYGPCGLCAIHDLASIGIDSLKIVGREQGPFRKMASVKMVADIARRVRSGADRLVTIERARSLRNEPQHCDAGYMCYYRG